MEEKSRLGVFIVTFLPLGAAKNAIYIKKLIMRKDNVLCVE